MRICIMLLRPQHLWSEGVIPLFQSFRCLLGHCCYHHYPCRFCFHWIAWGLGQIRTVKEGGFSLLSLTLRNLFFHFSEQKEDYTLILILYSGFLSVYMMYHFLSFYFYQSVSLYLNWISFRYSIPDSYIFIHSDIVFNNLKFNVYTDTFYHLAVCILYIPSVLCPSFLL